VHRTSLRRRAAQELADRTGDLLGARERSQVGVARDRHDAPLLRDDDAQGIRSLREPERRCVSRPPFANGREIARKRQVHGEPRHAVSHHEDRAVVTGRVRVEQAEDQRLADPRVERDPAFHMPLEGLPTGNHDEGSGARLRQTRDGASQRVDHVERGRRRLAPKPPDGELLEETPQIVLKDHDDDEYEDGEEALKDPGGQLEVEPPRGQVYGGDQHHADQREAGARVPQPDDSRPQQERDQQYVESVRQPHGVTPPGDGSSRSWRSSANTWLSVASMARNDSASRNTYSTFDPLGPVDRRTWEAISSSGAGPR
jgi:hypothetical protein